MMIDMKFSSYIGIITAFLATALMVSCKGEDEVVPDSTFKLDGQLLSVSVSGGSYTVAYSIEGAKAGSIASVVPEDSWLKAGEITDSTFVLEVDANAGGADRTGKVVLSCDGTRSATLHVLQSKQSDASSFYNNYSIEVSNVTTSSVDVVVVPVDAAASYYCTILSKSDYEDNDAGDLITYFINYLSYYASVYGADPNELLYTGYFDSSEVETSMNLNDNSEYYVFVFDLKYDASGAPVYSGKYETYKFRTRQATQVGMDFDIQVSGTTLTVTPSADYTYICDVTTKASWDEYSTPTQMAQYFVSLAKNYGVLDSYLYTGVHTEDISADLEESGEYVAYAVGYRNSSTDGGLTTSVKYVTFTYTK